MDKPIFAPPAPANVAASPSSQLWRSSVPLVTGASLSLDTQEALVRNAAGQAWLSLQAVGKPWRASSGNLLPRLCRAFERSQVRSTAARSHGTAVALVYAARYEDCAHAVLSLLPCGERALLEVHPAVAYLQEPLPALWLEFDAIELARTLAEELSQGGFDLRYASA